MKCFAEDASQVHETKEVVGIFPAYITLIGHGTMRFIEGKDK
jgi:hypothetical protein